MITSTYSSGIVSEACWFIEFKEYLKMLRNGASEDEIKKSLLIIILQARRMRTEHREITAISKKELLLWMKKL